MLCPLLRKKNVAAALFKIISRDVTQFSLVNDTNIVDKPVSSVLKIETAAFLETLVKTAGCLATMVPVRVLQINCVTSHTTAVLLILIAPVVGCCKYGNEP